MGEASQDLKDYLTYCEELLGRVRRRKAWLDPQDFQFGIDLFDLGVPAHVIERVAVEVVRQWYEAHPLFRQMGVCGITKLRYFRQAILREFKEYRTVMSQAGEGGACDQEEQDAETVPGAFL